MQIVLFQISVLSLIVKNISISNYSVYSKVLIQTIQFSISIDFVYTQLNVKNSSISNNLA